MKDDIAPRVGVGEKRRESQMSLTPAAADTLRRALATAVVVPVTPYHADGTPDWSTYAALTARLIDAGISVITPNGNTGEFYALSPAEARQALETAAKVASAAGGEHGEHGEPGAEVLAGVGHDIATAIEAARHAQDHGARMIMIHQPVHPYVSAEGWVDYHAAIANAVPDLGIVLYIRDERRTGAHIAALADRAPNVMGVKYGVRDATKFAAVARDAGLGRMTWLAGAAELTAPAFWAVGAHGFTSGLANVSPALALGMLGALRNNDFHEAMRTWEAVRRFEELRLADGSADNVSVVKEALAQLGLCRADVRPPSRPLPDNIKSEISGILRSWGLA
jgi:4-hydroxy-tetrahydrodipicolinate synthase